MSQVRDQSDVMQHGAYVSTEVEEDNTINMPHVWTVAKMQSWNGDLRESEA